MADKKKKTPAPASTGTGTSAVLDYIETHAQLILLGLLAVISIILFKDFLFFKKIYLFKDIGSDSINMYVPWVNCFADYMKAEGTPAWSFQQGMGQNIFPLWLGDYFSWFLMHLDKQKIPYYLAYVEVIKIILSGFVFYRFLKELKLSNYVSLIFALMYAFSGFMILGGSWVIYSIEALDIAVILYGFERWLNRKRILWFVVGIALLTSLQPALLLPWTIFLAVYITVRYFDVYSNGIKGFTLFTAKTIALATLGVVITGYQLLPDILQIKESPRVEGGSAFFEKLQGQSVFAPAEPALRFTTVFRSFGSDMIGNGNNFRGWYNYLEAPLFYCGILCLLAFPLFFSSLNRKQKLLYGVVTALFCLPLIFPYFRYMFWAFSGDYFRTFSLVIVLFLIIYSARALNHIERVRNVNKIVLGITLLALLFLLFTPATEFKAGINEGMRNVAAVLLLGYGFFIFRLGTAKAAVENLKAIFLLVIVVELIYFSYGTVNKRETMRARELTDRIGYNDYTLDALNYLKEKDKSFYRLNKDYMSGLAMHGSINDAKAQGFYGTSSYHSFNQKNYIRFLGDLGVVNVKDEASTRWAPGLGSRPLLFTLSAGKYWLTKQPGRMVASMGYDSLTQFGDVKVYRNRYYTPLGITYNTVFNEEALQKMSNLQKDLALLKAAAVAPEDASTFAQLKQLNLGDTLKNFTFEDLQAEVAALKHDTLKIDHFSENHITGTVASEAPEMLYLSFPLDAGWKAKVNNADVQLYRVNAGMTGLMLNKGQNTIDLQFEPRLKKQGGLLSIAGILILAGLVGLGIFKRRKEKLAA